MSPTRLFALVLLPALLLGACSSGDNAGTATTDQFVVPPLPARPAGMGDHEFAKVKRSYDEAKGRIEREPGVSDGYVAMAQLFMQEARITANHHVLIPAARAVLQEGMRRIPNSYELIVLNAALLMTLHQFTEARTMAERAVAMNRYHSFGYGVLCDARLETGDYEGAVRAADSMTALRPDLRSYARVSYLRELYGRRSEAVDAMRMAADAGANGTEERCWTLYNLAGLYMDMGKIDTAAYIYRGILEERPDYPFALSGLAMTKLAKGDTAGAITDLVTATGRIPDHTMIEQLADLYAASGDSTSRAAMEAQAVAAFEQHERDGWNTDREMAQFLLNHNIRLDDAVRRAERDYRRRPDNIDAEMTWAHALAMSGRAAEAAPVIRRALRLGSDNPRLLYIAALVLDAAGDRAAARECLEKVYSRTSFIQPIYNAPALALRARLKGAKG